MRRKKRISLLLLVCFSVLLGHNLVPHHHLIEAPLMPAGTPCAGECEEHHDPRCDPLHCQAFNGLDFFKSESTGHYEEPGEGSFHVAILPVPEKIEPAGVTGLPPYPSVVHTRKIALSRPHLLRGPPDPA